MDIESITYPNMNSIAYWLRPVDVDSPFYDPLKKHLTAEERLIGYPIYWEHKRDGSNLGVYLDAGDAVQCRTRNAIYAQSSIRTRFLRMPESAPVIQAITEARAMKVDLVVFGEYMEKGMSPARFENHECDSFEAFDVWNDTTGRWMNFQEKTAFFTKYKIPSVQLFGVDRYYSIDKILRHRDLILDLQAAKLEGTVGKVYLPGGYINFFKEKHAEMILESTKRPRVEDPRPELPDSEIWGAIDKARVELNNDDFHDPRHAMPLIAKYISIECEKHGCKMTRKANSFYKQKLEDMALAEA